MGKEYSLADLIERTWAILRQRDVEEAPITTDEVTSALSQVAYTTTQWVGGTRPNIVDWAKGREAKRVERLRQQEMKKASNESDKPIETIPITSRPDRF
jgi:hypothetical protein